MSRVCGIFLCSLILAACSAGGEGPGRDGLVEQSTGSPPALGPGAYPLPLITGWPTGNVAHSFDVNNNALTIAGGATATNAANGYWNIPVQLEIGQSIAAVGLTVQDTAGAPVIVLITARDPLSGSTTTWCQGASNGTGVRHSFTFGCTGTVPSGITTMQLSSQGPGATIFGASMQLQTSTAHVIGFHSFHPLHPTTSSGWDYLSFYSTDSTGEAYASIDLPAGTTLVGGKMWIRGQTHGQYSLVIKTYNSLGGGSVVATSNLSSLSGIDEVLTLPTFNLQTLAGESLQLALAFQGTIPAQNPAQNRVYSAEIDTVESVN